MEKQIKWTSERSIATGKISRYAADKTVAGRVMSVKHCKTERGAWWEVNHPLAGGHKFDHGCRSFSTLAEAKAHAEQMLVSLGA